MMPSGAAKCRAAQKEVLAGAIYEKVMVLPRPFRRCPLSPLANDRAPL